MAFIQPKTGPTWESDYHFKCNCESNDEFYHCTGCNMHQNYMFLSKGSHMPHCRYITSTNFCFIESMPRTYRPTFPPVKE